MRQKEVLAQAGFKLTTFLPQPPKYWDFSHAPPYLAQIIVF
jgi:hypothetical protein